MMSGSVISAITRMVPPQKGHRLISKLKTRLSLCAQLKGAINSSSTLATVSALYSPLSLFFLVFVFLPLVGTMRFLIRAFGANMP